MKILTTYLKIISFTTLSIILLLLIWLAPLLFELDDNAFFANLSVQVLLTIIMVLITGFITYITYFIKPVKSNNNPDKDQLSCKKNQKKQRIIFRQHAREVFDNLKIAFQIWGHKKQRYLRKLPWYLVLGSANSGKSSLLANSGLDFSPTEILGQNPLQIEHYHRDFVWLFSKEAVMLEIHGNQSTNTSWGINLQDPFWAGILKLIKRYRRQQPLNGAIVTLSLPDLLMQTDKNRQWQTQSLKNILQTIQQNLKIQTSIYIILTKCDLMAGFQEYFSDLAKEDQEQVWGINFSTQTLSQQQIQDYFKQAFDQLIIRLQERLLLRLETEQDSNKRQLISYFPQQIQLCKNVLSDLILQDENAKIRGIYFVSNLQNGKPYDFLLSAIAKKYNLSAPIINQPAPCERAYFTQKLFPTIILPDADYVANSPTLQRIRTYRYHACCTGAILVLILGSIGLSISYTRNKNSLASIQHYLPEYRQTITQLSPANTAVTAVLPLLNILKNMSDTYLNSTNPWLLYFELYQPLKIRNTMDTIWQRTLSNQFMSRIALQLETMLNQYQNNPEVLYKTLKAYLVFSPADNTNPHWIKPPITYDTSTNLKDQPDEQIEINNYLNAALAYPVDALPLNQKLITKTRERLRKVMPVEFAYYEIKQEAANTDNQFNIVNKLGPNFSNTFILANNNLQSIPTLFTFAGYQDLHGKKSEFLIKHTAEIYWILGLDQTAHGNDLITVMTPELWSRYSNDYINHWNNLLANIHSAPFTNLSQAIQTLNLLTTSHSPLLNLLYLIKENTFFIHNKKLRIAQHYAALNAITGLPGKPSPQYNTFIKNLVTLRDYLITLNNAPNISQLEFQEASAYLQNKTPNNPIAILKKQAQQMPAPLNRWLNEIADNSFNLLLQGAHQVINTAWQNNVVSSYQTNIQGRFPFNNQSDTYVDITSFANFFGNNGVLMQFFQTYLAPFIDTSHATWRQYQVGTYSLGLTASTIAQLENAMLIHNMYFQNANSAPLIEFSIRPRFLDPQASSIYIQLANQNLTYQHGPQQFLSWKWPMPSATQQVNIAISDFQGQSFSHTFDGPWAWFKLLSITQLQATGTPGHYIWTINQAKHQASFDLWIANNLPVFDLQTLQNFNLPGNI